jgi:hypothetical protein
MWVIEFQKRGLPHAHILLTFSTEHKMRNPADYDTMVCAEFPDQEEQRTSEGKAEFERVKKFNIHGPCGFV